MKLVQDVNAFLNDAVNVNSTRFKQFESSIEAIKAAVRDWKPSTAASPRKDPGLTRPSSSPDLEIRSIRTYWFT
ncbi:hypothetical protein [Variovorax sp. OV700]|uniref:hypothetical protein n=1 Tax=Variovorax sp. OV700 TaxID=1882826 RepID=UPI000890B77E|nr:hypothetical protein [Variovorax sp. OV700]SDI19381.1 hypothetical protein SAMN05444748_10487 [Variovorax sp. OV700]